jgi:influenza virus NS1A-binding protein
VAPMSQARCTHSAVSLSDSQEILVFGGFDYVPLDTVEKFNVISNEWESVCKMPTPRFMHSSLLIRED